MYHKELVLLHMTGNAGVCTKQSHYKYPIQVVPVQESDQLELHFRKLVERHRQNLQVDG